MTKTKLATPVAVMSYWLRHLRHNLSLKAKNRPH